MFRKAGEHIIGIGGINQAHRHSLQSGTQNTRHTSHTHLNVIDAL